jgi:hypothetical protein
MSDADDQMGGRGGDTGKGAGGRSVEPPPQDKDAGTGEENPDEQD